MSVLDGVSQCWWLGETCAVNWDAWAAVGTVFAAVVALGLGLVAYLRDRGIEARRRQLAVGICRVLAARLYEEANALGVNSGVITGQWDEYTVTFVERSAVGLGKTCREIEKYLLDVPPSTGKMLAEVITKARGLSEDISAFEKHEMKTRILIAELITQDAYSMSNEIIATESSLMPLLGGQALANRVKMDRRPRNLQS